MKIGTITTAAGILALGLASSVTPGHAQSPMFDRVEANIPYSFTVGDKTLPPGQYVIQQSRDFGGDQRALTFASDNGTKFETTCITIPTLDVNTPDRTQVVLHHYGPDYYFDKVWIQGKDYGYECPLPSAVKQREKERMEPVTIAATYSTTTEQPQTTPAPAPQTTEAAPPPPPPPATVAPAPPPPMPKTNAGWLMMLLGGGALSGIGLSLRRFKA
jgi:cell division septation protein DedD